MPPLVSVVITTYNSARWLEFCLNSLTEAQYRPLEVIIVDNASIDGTREILEPFRRRFRVILNNANIGFAAAQNQAIGAAQGQWLLSLNPDVIISPTFIGELVAAGQFDEGVGTVCGKLLRLQGEDWRLVDAQIVAPQIIAPQIIDSTGIYFARNLRHFDRGSEETDHGQYDHPEYVFGATGAAALYRRKLVDDISIEGEFFDEDFFAYREDADLAWRAQIMGWKCVYTPSAVAWHARRVTPQRRAQLPHIINWHSIKNRFLMRAKNISPGLYLRLAAAVTARDVLIAGHCLLRDWKMLSALSFVWKQRDKWRRERALIQARRRVPDSELARWFSNRPVAFPVTSSPRRKAPQVWRAA